MKQTKTSFDKAPKFTEEIPQIPWINNYGVDYQRLINKPSSSWDLFLAYDVWSTGWATGDGTFRDVNIIGSDWDMQVSYSQEILVGRGSTTANITRRWTAEIIWNDIQIPAWWIVNIQIAPWTDQVRIVKTWWNLRYIKWSSLDMTSTNNEITFINSSTSTSSIKLQFATATTNRPIFGILITIK